MPLVIKEKDKKPQSENPHFKDVVMTDEEVLQNLHKKWATTPMVVPFPTITELLLDPASELDHEVEAPPISLSVVNELEAMVQEYLILHTKYVKLEIKQITDRMEEIKKILHETANEDVPAAEICIFSCDQGELEFTPRAIKTVVPVPITLLTALTHKFGVEAAYSVVNIAITPLKKMLSEKELEPFVEKIPESRKLKEVRHKKS